MLQSTGRHIKAEKLGELSKKKVVIGDLERTAELLEEDDQETWSYCDLGRFINLGSCMICL